MNEMRDLGRVGRRSPPANLLLQSTREMPHLNAILFLMRHFIDVRQVSELFVESVAARVADHEKHHNGDASRQK